MKSVKIVVPSPLFTKSTLLSATSLTNIILEMKKCESINLFPPLRSRC